MKELTPDIALEKYYEMWIAMAKAEKEKEKGIIRRGLDRFEFRMNFKKDWCKEKGENPVNYCYLCEYAMQQASLNYQNAEEFTELLLRLKLCELESDEVSPTVHMADSICRHCPILWGKDRDNNNCENNTVNWTLSPIKDILMLPLNQKELDEYSKNHT